MELQPNNPIVIGLVITYYSLWTIAYIVFIIEGYKKKTYCVPMAAICLNVTWEFLFGFMYPNSVMLATWLNRIWFIFDVVIIFQLILYGKNAQVWSPLKKIFYPLVVFMVTSSALGLITFKNYYGDTTGAESSYFMNFWMSLGFLGFLYYRRKDLVGISYLASWLKMLGTALATIVLHFTYWTVKPDVPSFSIIDFLGLNIFIIDCYYIYLVNWYKKRHKNLELTI